MGNFLLLKKGRKDGLLKNVATLVKSKKCEDKSDFRLVNQPLVHGLRSVRQAKEWQSTVKEV